MLTANDLKHQVRKVWDFDRSYLPSWHRARRTSTQIGILARRGPLAHRDKKRLVVDIQPDGDLMFDAGALWIAAKYQIPDADRDAQQPRLLQRLGAPDLELNARSCATSTDEAKAHIGMDLMDPEPDFAGLLLDGLLR